jgi:hypothetical protein
MNLVIGMNASSPCIGEVDILYKIVIKPIIIVNSTINLTFERPFGLR